MEKPLFTLSGKDFLTGIAPSAHSVRGGLFYKATGIASVSAPGATESTDNGLLRGGPVAIDIGGVTLADTPIAATKYITSGGTPTLYIMGASGHLYTHASLGSSITDLRSGGSVLANSANGLAVLKPKSGVARLYYTGKTFIGRSADLEGALTFNDTWVTTNITSSTQHPLHAFEDRIYHGNYDKVGMIYDNDAGDAAYNSNVLDIPANYLVTALADDGVYLAVVITNNTASAAVLGDTRILFWDKYSSSWNREYAISDQFILSAKRMGNSILLQGQRGIYEVSFDGGVRKVLARLTGLTSTGSNRQIGPGLAGIYNQEGYLFCGGQYVGALGKLSEDAPKAFHIPIQITTNTSINPSLIETQYDVGRIIVGTDEPKLYLYVFGGTSSGQTSVSAQTVYLPLADRYSIKRIDVIFGEPLASGDAFDIDTKTDEDTAAVDFGSASFATDGAIRRKSMFPAAAPTAETLSLVLNFTGGVVKVKKIMVYGDLMTA